MGCPCKKGNRRAATASGTPKPGPSQPPGSPGKPLLWTGPEDKKPDGK